MSKLNSLVSLIHSLSKSERKKISTMFGKTSDYVFLFRLIEQERSLNIEDIKNKFYAKRRNIKSFNVTVNYLFELLLNTLVNMRSEQDNYFKLFNMLLQAKVLYEKSIYKDCFELLGKIKELAVYYDNHAILLIAEKIEMEWLLSLDFPNTTEAELLSKQSKISNTLNRIRKINEHASLFGLLKHRILHKGSATRYNKRQNFDDLVVSEISIVSNSDFNNFEIEKNHKLFQANYLMNAGDYKSALNSLYELNSIFEKNMHLLSNPPIYYLNTIEKILEGLRYTQNYEGMKYFVEKLCTIKTSSHFFNTQVLCTIFLYKLFPLIDKGNFEQAKELLNEYKESLIDKSSTLILAQRFKLMLYEAIVCFGNKEYDKAKKTFFKVFYSGKNSVSLLDYKAARFLYLISLFELREGVDDEINSIRLDLKKSINISERILLRFVAKAARGRYLKRQVLEKKIFSVFNFNAWIEAKVTGTDFSYFLSDLFSNNEGIGTSSPERMFR